MSVNLKLNLLFSDRVGIVADISARVAQSGLNILSMEVARRDDKADVYLEIEPGSHLPNREDLFELLGNIVDLLQIRTVKTLPHEKREHRLRVMLDNISDGVIAIDKQGQITAVNKIVQKVLDRPAHKIIGKNIKALNFSDYGLLECLAGNGYTHEKKTLITPRGRFHYFATGRPIKDSSGRIIGAVEIGKDMEEIKMLARSISQPQEVTFNDIIGENQTIKQAIAFAYKIAPTDSIIAVRGPSGTGKELLARAIHHASKRKGPFVPINCAALPEALLESELFGYVGGAFTGARKEGKPGLFETAENGTIFLDEIAEMPLGPQARILRLIQEKSVRRIGGNREIPINARILTATNQNLEQMVAEKLFRQDLFYRINVLPIHIPPLKERIDDIPLLVEHFLFQLSDKLGQEARALSVPALNKLYRHNWPGNVRELKNVVERAAILCEEDRISEDCVLFSHEIGKGIHDVKTAAGTDLLGVTNLKYAIARYEKQIIQQTLSQSRSIRQSAKSLSISHTALLNKIKKHHIQLETK